MRQIIAQFVTIFLILPGLAHAQTRFVNVQGEGHIEVVPDMATISLGVQHQAQTADEAFGLVATASRAVIDQLAVFGIEERDIQSTGLSLRPVYDRRNDNSQPPDIIGFFASNNLSVRLRDLDRTGELLDRMVRVGATNVGGISFSYSQPEQALDAARNAAVMNALAKAQTYAQAAGAEVGEVMEISEISGGSPAPGMIRMEAMAMDSMPISPGSMQVSVRIMVKISLR